MKSVEKTGRTVEEAIEAALLELGAERDQCEVEVLDEGNKGFFGLLGSKPARVRVAMKAPPAASAAERGRLFLEGLLGHMGVVGAIETRVDDDGAVHMNVTGSGLGTIIGRRGQTLDAIQYLVSVVANQESPEWVRIVVDAEGYRERRAQTLTELAQRTAEKAKARGRRMRLEPMTAAERRLIHLALRDDPDVETRSEGEEPFRRVVIVPRN